MNKLKKRIKKALFKKVTKIQQNLYRKIEWVGYVKNSLLDKKIYSNSKSNYNKDEYGIIGKLSLPFMPIFYGIYGAVVGAGGGMMSLSMHPGGKISDKIAMPIFGILGGSVGIIGGIFQGVYEQYKICKDIMKLNQNERVIYEGFRGNINKKNQKDQIKLDNNELKENLKKFVFFKNEKIIGFIRFAQDITPPVNGYYFNCNFNFKVEIHMFGMIFNQDKSIKNQIDFYDGKDYINKMKKLLSVD